MDELFNPQSSSVQSSRILYTPSTFARTSLLHLQEVGLLQAIHPHTSTRTDLVSFLCFVVLALNEGRLVIIDELDAKLHPKLLRYVISMFKNPKLNQNGAQLIFTSHDVTTMRNTVFRRDEIWFAAENDNHESEIYSLYEIRREDNERVNNTAAYDKQYLEGRYGADPYLSNMLTGGEWE